MLKPFGGAVATLIRNVSTFQPQTKICAMLYARRSNGVCINLGRRLARRNNFGRVAVGTRLNVSNRRPVNITHLFMEARIRRAVSGIHLQKPREGQALLE